MQSQGYKFGKALGQNVVIVVVFMLVLWVIYAAWPDDLVQPAEPVAAVTQQERVMDKANTVKAHAEACVAAQAVRLDKARQLYKAQQFDAAAELLFACTGNLSDDEKSLYVKALTAGNAARAKVADAEAKVAAVEAKAIKARKKQEGVTIGMTDQDALDSSWGKPNKINRTTNAYGVREQWVYDGGYLYFTNGVLTSIQN